MSNIYFLLPFLPLKYVNNINKSFVLMPFDVDVLLNTLLVLSEFMLAYFD